MPGESERDRAGSRDEEELAVETEPVFDGCYLVTLEGELDLQSAPVLEEAIAGLHRQNARTLILNLEDCHFVDSTGLQVVLKSTRGLDGGTTELLLAGASGPVLKLFETTGVTNMVLVYETVEQAKHAALG
jgi:anti-anti-sigma factor